MTLESWIPASAGMTNVLDSGSRCAGLHPAYAGRNDESAVPVPRNTPPRNGPDVPVSTDLFVQKTSATRYFSDEVKMKISE